MELLQYWRVIRKSLWLILLVVALGLSGATYYTLNQSTRYESSTTLLLNPAVPSALVPYVQAQVAANLADSYSELMRTRFFGESVVKELPFPMSAESVGGAIGTELEPNTLFYRITVTMDTPEQAQQLANTVVKVFLDANASQQEQASQSSQVDSPRNQMRKRMQDKLEYLDEEIASYQRQLDALEAEPKSPERDTQIQQLRGQMIALQESQTNTMLAIAQLPDNSVQPNTALVVDPALPGSPISANLTTSLQLALAASLLLGLGLAFLRDYLDYTVRSPEYLEEMLHLTPLAGIGIVGEGSGRAYGYGGRRFKGNARNVPKGRVAGRSLVTLDFPSSPESESFRVLRTNIQFASVDRPVRTLVVTSPGPGEGKTFTSTNLAVVVAQAGKRVILVDTDLRKPSVHRALGLQNVRGFTNLVLDSADTRIADVVQTIPGQPNLAIITSGPLPPNPSELLSSQHVAHTMQRLAEQADLVIYDTPPAAAVADPMIMASQVDAVLLVIAAGATRRDMVTRVKQAMEKVGARAVFPVLNRVKASDIHGYAYYHQYYGTQPDQAKANGHKARANGKGIPLDSANLKSPDEPALRN
ncbi:MAG: polysaccharide biosynthesis tyrosine autokinase [Chloroflexia bacterium]